MTNYNNEIMDLLPGETPRQKYDYLHEILKIFLNENKENVETILLSEVDRLQKIGEELFKAQGTNSYLERCDNADAYQKIYALTNKSRIEKMTFIQWRENIQKIRS